MDPGEEASLLLQKVPEDNIELPASVDTHPPIEPLSGIGLVQEPWKVPIYLHTEDEPLDGNLSTQAPPFGLDDPPVPPLDHPRKAAPLGEEKISHPGHGPDSTIGHELKTTPFLAD